MNKTLVAILVAGLATATASYAKESESEHAREHGQEKAITAAPHSEQDNHDDHREENHEEHDDHKPDTEHGHAEHGEDVNSDHKDAHDDHGDENHDEHSAHDEHNSGSEHGHEEHSEGGDHGDHGGNGGHQEAASASLNPAQMTLADIQINPLTPRKVDYQLYAPGEILSNGYTSYRVSPRVPSVVLRRHVALGDHVEQSQPLVTLFSETVAQAQANYRTAWPEWQRVQELGRKTVGEQRYFTAKTNLEAARATLLAYGLSASDLQALVASQQSVALGEYTLHAEIDGAVLRDDFEQGQRIEAGAPLIALADEKQLWVEAHLPADLSLTLGAGTRAEVVAGDVRVNAKVTQEAHTIDPISRTRTVRLLVNNPEHRLHPGQFAEVYFRFQTKRPVLAVPETALMRGADGDWTVFVEDHPGEFQPVEVELGRALGPLREISGVGPGARIVTQGAFFVASQIAKGGFDPHNH
ncbi:efflux RND transporter periplasmic adaptor subunit [Thalassolituus sp. UBA2590]|uniref:efflux RND transporter periplasmic adaptor subunit n=1 Tax=Thalassolituus sp. UBA2590 TaxID=1947663 RepID=UPI002649F27A|nr:efflux RND transporter periplasmic adaptor subunit [Thalassolituus sp. UBA2590]